MKPKMLVATFSVFIGAAALYGCNDQACSKDLLRPDGGFYGCVISEDCPRQSSDVFVCLNNKPPAKKCVRCTEEARCVEVSSDYCR